MIFKKWEGVLYHENLKDFILEESLLMEIFPGEKYNPDENNEIKGIIMEESKKDSIKPPHISHSGEVKRERFEACGQYDSVDHTIYLEYKDKTATIKARLFVETMEIKGNYTFKDKHQREVSMVIELSPC